MLKFAPDSIIDFSAAAARESVLYLEWVWSGTFEGALRLPDGEIVPANGCHFDVTGIAACQYEASGLLTSHRDFWDARRLVAQPGNTT